MTTAPRDPSDPFDHAEAMRPLTSALAGETDLEEVIAFFVGHMDERIERLEASWATGDHAQLLALARELKGAAGGFGFPSIRDRARDLESELLAAEAEVSALQERLEALAGECRRAVAPG